MLDHQNWKFYYALGLRYRGQGFAITIPISSGALQAEALPSIIQKFHRKHVESYDLSGVAPEMSAALIRTVFPPNKKSGAITPPRCSTKRETSWHKAGNIPVHLGATPFSVQAALLAVRNWKPGEVVILNDPYRGGAHFPGTTLTFAASVFLGAEVRAFVAYRAHHANVGGMAPGGLPRPGKFFREG